MFKIILSVFLLTSLVYASNQKKIHDKNIQAQLEKEKKYAKEQRFYSEKEYDFSSAEVNPESVKNLKEIEPLYDFDMDDVYD